MKNITYRFEVVGVRPDYEEFYNFLDKVSEKIKNSLSKEVTSHARTEIATFWIESQKPLVPEQIDKIETILARMFSKDFSAVTITPIEVKKHV